MRQIDFAEKLFLDGLAEAQQGLHLATKAASDLERLTSDAAYYADGARQCRGYGQTPHKTTERFVSGLCKSCYDRRRYAENRSDKS